MYVVRASSPREVLGLAHYKDGFEAITELNRVETLQFIIQQIQNPNVGVWIVYNEAGGIIGWLFALLAQAPPLTNEVVIVFAHSSGGMDVNKVVMEQLEKWARDSGAKRITAMTSPSKARLFHQYGFSTSEVVLVVKVLNGE